MVFLEVINSRLFISFTLIFLAIEVYFRFNLYRISQSNKLIITARQREFDISNILMPFLWDIPWYEYRKNAEIKGRSGNG